MKISRLTLAISSLLALQVSTQALAESTINGFASIGYTNSKNNSGFAGINDSNMYPESLFGLQGNFDVNESVEATVQVVARGNEEWDLEVSQANLSYKFDNGIKARAGVIRAPFFLLSEYLDVGYAQPWARSPEEVYGLIPVDSVTGVDVQYEFSFDDSYLALQVFAGSQKFSFAGVDGEGKDAYGLNATWYDDSWTLHASYSQATIVADEINQGSGPFPKPVLSEGSEDASFASVGARYDNGVWLAMSEITHTRISNNDGIPLYPENNAGYVTLGYHINSVMPYISYSRIETLGIDDTGHMIGGGTIETAFDYERNSYSLGARWDIKQGLALKADVTYSDYADTNGGTIGGLTSNADDDYIYTIKLDATF
ncbi:hypothetical protein [Aliivibrio logei]|uniref:hypothetical protein n=1 Tax=Aliivibrio logei TaxID=688 RepID=UPI0035C8A811